MDLHVSNTYLPLGPDMGLNEVQHRRSASFESDMSYQMRRFLVEDGYHQTEHENGGNANFLQQDVKIGYGCTTSKKVNKGSKPSWVSGSSGRASNEELAWSLGQRGEMMRDVGAWMDGYGGVKMERGVGQVYEYPMVLSGITECGFGEGN